MEEQKNISTNKETGQYLQALQEFTSRMMLSAQLGYSYSGDRDLYEALGYDKELTFDKYFTAYSRTDIAGAIIDRPIKRTWKGDLLLLESDDEKETALEKGWKAMDKELRLKNSFIQLDRLASIGQYALLFFGLSDADKSMKQAQPVKGSPKLLYLKVVSQKDSEIVSYESSMISPRYGMPLVYKITLSNPDGSTSSLQVHYSRIMHVAYDCIDGTLIGTPQLKKVYNRCKDIEKVSGGSAEMYWRGARPGYGGKVDKDFQMTTDMEDDMKTQIKEYENNLRRILITQGVELNSLSQQISDPAPHLDVQMQLISAATGIPKRILVGTERGELASSQDQDEWNSLIDSRREEYAEAHIIRPFVEYCIKNKILSGYKDSFSVAWEPLSSQSDKEKAEVGKIRAAALKDYVSQPMAQSIVPEKAFFEMFLGLDAAQAELIQQMMEAEIDLEADDFEEEPIEEGIESVEEEEDNE